jgi:uncharacterized membrane protein YedE/YeeE
MNAGVTALAGGVLIGLSAVLLMLTLGRIAGLLGIIGGLLGGGSGDIAWRIAFVMGIIAGPFAAMLCGASLPEIRIDASVPVTLVAGSLVGFGSRLANGCTSGHGVCGLARVSPRSLAATLTFMTVAAAVVLVAHHVCGG